MRTILISAVSLLSLLVSSALFAYCGTCNGNGAYHNDAYRAYAYNASSCCGSPSCNPHGDGLNCQCTEPHCGKNDCLSRKECCEAFGNVGAR